MKTHNLIKSTILILSFLTLSFGLFAQRTVDRPTGNFDEVVAFGNVEVVLTEGDDYEIKLKAYNIESEKVATEVSGGKLSIKLQSVKKEQSAVIYVTAPRFREIRAQAGARIYSDNTLTGDKIFVSAMAGGRVELEVEVNEIEGRASEGGTLSVTGSGNNLKASASNGGEVESLKLDAKNVYVKANVGGVAKVAVLERLEATAKAGGRVIYAGNPDSQSITTALGGTVVPKD
jgi:hypothetical protein